ncbi:MAG: hypothetical protein [Podoviridae sp. cty5g4]|nr:MAG: hypothetical protein [Podoviridae sp. cty5g4]
MLEAAFQTFTKGNKMKMYLTKNVLTHVIRECDGEISEKFPNLVSTNIFLQSVEKPFWHLRKEDAIDHAELIKERKLKSLAKQIEKIENIEFT